MLNSVLSLISKKSYIKDATESKKSWLISKSKTERNLEPKSSSDMKSKEIF